MVRTRIIVAAAALLIVGTSVLARLSEEPGWVSRIRYREQYRVSNEIISRVETFKERSGLAPASLDEVGVVENDRCPCYQRISPSEFEVWFGTSLGESIIYESETRAWR